MNATTLDVRSPPLVLQTLNPATAATIGKAAGFVPVIDAATIDRITQRMLDTAARTLPADGNANRNPSTVNLRAPGLAQRQSATSDERSRLSPDAALSALLGQLAESLDVESTDKLRQRVASHRAALSVRLGLAGRLGVAQGAADAALDGAEAELEAAGRDFNDAKADVDAAREDVAWWEDALAGLAEDDPSRPDHEASLSTARQNLAQARKVYNRAAERVVDAGKRVESAGGQAAAVRKDVDRFNAGHVVRLQPPEERLSASAKLQELLGMLSVILADHSLDKLKNDSRQLMKQLEARDAENLARAKKHADEQERARDVGDKTGCAGKVLNWIKAALATVASAVVIAVGVLTANPMMVAGGIMGLALSIDYVVQLATGFSVVGKLTEVVGKGIAAALQAFGVDEKLAQTIGNITATILVTAALIIAAIATGNGAAAVQGLTRAVATAQQIAQVVQVIAQVAGLAGDITRAAGQIVVANIAIDIAELTAAIERHLLDSEVLREMLTTLAQAASSIDETALDLVRRMGQVNEDQAASARQVLSHIRTTA